MNHALQLLNDFLLPLDARQAFANMPLRDLELGFMLHPRDFSDEDARRLPSFGGSEKAADPLGESGAGIASPDVAQNRIAARRTTWNACLVKVLIALGMPRLTTMTQEKRRQEFLAEAKEAEEMAARCKGHILRDSWLNIAESYRELARCT
jgi:hypothetical protein